MFGQMTAQQIAQRIASIRVRDEQHREAIIRPIVNAAEILTPSFQFDGSFQSYLVDQLTVPRHNLALSTEHTQILENPDVNDPDVIAAKTLVMSHVMQIEEVRKFHQLTRHGIVVQEFLANDAEYQLFLGSETGLRHGCRVVVCKTMDLSQVDLSFYYGVVEVLDSYANIRCLHADDRIAGSYFAQKDEISVFYPPYENQFEAYQHVVESLDRDLIFRHKFFPDPIPATEPLFDDTDIMPRGNRDDAQMAAIKGIVEHNSSWIFVTHGPPGTGKTYVVTSAVIHIVAEAIKKKEPCHILITAPSNAACDVLFKRLFHDTGISNDLIVRICAPSVSPQQVDRDLLYNAFVRNGRFYIPHAEKKIDKFKVIICTINVASRLSYLPKGYFNYIIIDEAGQCLEMDTMIPVSLYANGETRVSVVGDPKQLPPFFADGILGQERFRTTSTSMERLCDRPGYFQGVRANGQVENADPRLRVTLNRNYRSHYSLVRPFSRLFYGGGVLAVQNNNALNRFVPPYFLPASQIPMRFHVCDGFEAERFVEGRRSFINQMECGLVRQYIHDIFFLYGNTVTEADIAVITPYRGQIELIKEGLEADNRHGIVVDSVSLFQGDERSIIILSLVRSRSIGFLREDRRLNVAISRPKHMLIVIGNLELLRHSEIYREYATMVNADGCLHDPDPLHNNLYWAAQLQPPAVAFHPPPLVAAAAVPLQPPAPAP